MMGHICMVKPIQRFQNGSRPLSSVGIGLIIYAFFDHKMYNALLSKAKCFFF